MDMWTNGGRVHAAMCLYNAWLYSFPATTPPHWTPSNATCIVHCLQMKSQHGMAHSFILWRAIGEHNIDAQYFHGHSIIDSSRVYFSGAHTARQMQRTRSTRVTQTVPHVRNDASGNVRQCEAMRAPPIGCHSCPTVCTVYARAQ